MNSLMDFLNLMLIYVFIALPATSLIFLSLVLFPVWTLCSILVLCITMFLITTRCPSYDNDNIYARRRKNYFID